MTERPLRPVLASTNSNRVYKPPSTTYRRDSYMDEVIDQEDITHSSSAKSNDSNISNLSILSDVYPNDDLDRRMLDHARIKQSRWTGRSALHVEKPFQRARLSADMASAMRNIESGDNLESDQRIPTTYQRPPSPNIPRQWGRKGRQRNDFLRRLNTDYEEPGLPTDYNSDPSESIRGAGHEPRNAPRQFYRDRRRTLATHNNPDQSREKEDAVGLSTTNPISPAQQVSKFSRMLQTSAKQDLSKGSQTAETRGKQMKEARDSLQRPGSRQLLQQLTRAASATPSPERGSANFSKSRPRTSNIALDPQEDGQAQSQDDYPRRSALGNSERQRDRTQIAPERYSTRAARVETDMAEATFVTNESMDEATVASLKELVDTDEAGDLTGLLQIDDNTLDLIRNVHIPLPQKETLQFEEKKALQRMIDALKSARMSIGDASLKITRTKRGHDPPRSDKSAHGVPESCPHCRGIQRVTLGDVLWWTWEAIRSYFCFWPDNGSMKLTWLGVVMAAFCIWSITEVMLCEFHCHPLYASSMDGYGVDIRRPRMPYVTTTIIIKRPVMWLVGPFLSQLEQVFIWLLIWIFSLFSGTPSTATEYFASRQFGNVDPLETDSSPPWLLHDRL